MFYSDIGVNYLGICDIDTEQKISFMNETKW